MAQNPPISIDFHDDLARRCFPHRFRRIGSPFAYLNEVGIRPVLEFICKGHMLIDVAEAVNVPLHVLEEWVDNEGHRERIAEAEHKSAEGYLAEAQRMLRRARTDFELKKANQMLKQAQFLAEKKNRPTYGNQKEGKRAPKMTYVFNIGAAPDPNAAKFAGRIIDATQNAVEKKEVEQINKPVTLTLPAGPKPTQEHNDLEPLFVPKDEDIPVLLGDVFGHLEEVDEAQPTNIQPPKPPTPPLPPTNIPRPLIPTADEPDIGPFYITEETP